MKNKKIISIFVSIVGLATFISATPIVYAEAIDITPPSDVEGISAKALDSAIELSWEAVTDDTMVAGYRIHYGLDSVTQDGGSYMYIEDTKNVLTTTIKNLENDVTYYFALTALDEAGNESEFYSLEVSATPSSDATSAEGETVTENEETETTPPANENEQPAEEDIVENEEPILDENIETENDSSSESINESESDSLEPEEEAIQEEPAQENTEAENVLPEGQEQELEAIAEVLAPIISNFIAKVEAETKVRLQWSVQNETNLKDQVLYQSEDGGKNYNNGKSLGAVLREYLIANLTPGQTYTFKLTAKDADGNESEGVVTSITLPQTGAGLAGLIAISLGLGSIISRKRK